MGAPAADSCVVDTYTRAQAIADGVLIDLAPVIDACDLQSPFKYPIAVTPRVFEQCINWPTGKGAHQDMAGRLHDVLTLAYFSAKQCDGNELVFDIVCTSPEDHKRRKWTLRGLCGPGDYLEPVITLQMADELD